MNETQERWKQLCAQAAVEHDTAKLLNLVSEINRLLEEKYDHRTAQTQNVSGNVRAFVNGPTLLR
jgi:hypothetical protein